jgi:hypothetical protein
LSEQAPDPEPVTGDVLLEVRGGWFTPNELDRSASRIELPRPTLCFADSQCWLVRPQTPVAARSGAISVRARSPSS